MDTEKKAKTTPPLPETLIYLGPTFRQPVLLMYGSVFREAFPTTLESCLPILT